MLELAPEHAAVSPVCYLNPFITCRRHDGTCNNPTNCTMRTSRVSTETARLTDALRPRRVASGFALSDPQDYTLHSISRRSQVKSSPLKRRRDDRESVSSIVRVKEEVISTSTSPRKAEASVHVKPKRAKRQPAKRIKGEDGQVKIEAPANWEEMYKITRQMRDLVSAPVDTMGCESLAEENRPPRDQRFQTLVALMLSSQTKDTVTSVAMRNLQQNLPGGFTIESVLAVAPEELNELISKVGFHNNKTKFIKATAEILRDRFDSDIPDTIEGLVSLPGVGPKMGYLCLSAAWGKDEGIGVDVHVHRITNLWGWHKTNTPEETRAALESWLPREKWHDINNLLVGFGQTYCPPVGRNCAECRLADGLCPSAVVGKKATQRIKREAVLLSEANAETPLAHEDRIKVDVAIIKAEDLGSDSETPIQDIEDIGIRRSSRHTVS